MGCESNKQKQNNNEQANFFQFTKHQLFLGLNKYESIQKNNPSVLLDTNVINTDYSQNSTIFQKRLNSLDSAMLEDSAYMIIDDPNLKLERKIENLEQTIKEIQEKLFVADTINDESTKQKLLSDKNLLSKKLENLKKQYESGSIETGIAAALTKLFNFPAKIKLRLIKSFKKFIRHSKIMQKFTPLVRAIMIRDTIGKLNKINKSVDELVKMHIPFGEQEEKYEALVNRLSKANALHTQMLKELKN